jgi:hypothetical protein
VYEAGAGLVNFGAFWEKQCPRFLEGMSLAMLEWGLNGISALVDIKIMPLEK